MQIRGSLILPGNFIMSAFAELLDFTLETLYIATFDRERMKAPYNGSERKSQTTPPEPFPRNPGHRSPMVKRIVSPHEETCYLLTSRICSNLPYFGADQMRVFRDQLERTAEFCGLSVLNYTILSDHFHLLVEIPKLSMRNNLTQSELIRRTMLLYGDEIANLLDTAFEVDAESTALEHFGISWLRRGAKLASPTETAADWATRELQRLRELMHDVSLFMKLLKQRFSLWFNSEHDRYGTLWGDRFRSLLVERTAASIQAASAYIDLNAVRRGLVEKPADYEFCGLAEANRGDGMGRRGICRVVGQWEQEQNYVTQTSSIDRHENPISEPWSEIAERHRSLLWGDLLGTHGPANPNAVAGAPQSAAELPAIRNGAPRLADFFLQSHDLLLRGVAMGSQQYIRQMFSDNREAFGEVSPKMAAYLLRHESLHAGSWGFAGMWVLRAKSYGLQAQFSRHAR
jgi:REP element-mobilizing transposase RayT